MGDSYNIITNIGEAIGYAKRPQGPPPQRLLTEREILEAKQVFSERIEYKSVRIIDGKFMPGQANDVVITPNGNLYWPSPPEDASTDMFDMRLLIHELTHVYQFQVGIDVLCEAGALQVLYYGSGQKLNPYPYKPGKKFHQYNLEQQGRISEDIWCYLKGYQGLSRVWGMQNILLQDSIENLQIHHLTRPDYNLTHYNITSF